MKHFVLETSETYPVVLLVKDSAFNQQEITQTYLRPMIEAGISAEDIIVAALPYNEHGKAPAKLIKEYYDHALDLLHTMGAKYIYCADAAYFKTLTKSRKAEPHLGYLLPCEYKEEYKEIKVTLGVNHKSLLYNPANDGKLLLSLNTFIEMITDTLTPLGAHIIKSAEYPTEVEHIRLWLQELHQYPELTCDIETASLDFEKAGIGTVTFCWSQHEGIAFPCDYMPYEQPVEGVYGVMLPNTEIRELLFQFFNTYRGTLTWHNSTYDLKVIIYALWMEHLMDTAGLLRGLKTMTKTFHDTKIIAYLAINSTAGNKLKLKELAHEFAGNWAQDDIKDITKIPLEDLLQYNLVDGLATWYVKNKYYPVMVTDQQEVLYEKLMLPSQRTIIQVELTGMPLNPRQVQIVKDKLEAIKKEQLDFFGTVPAIASLNTRLQQEAMEAANAKLKTKQHPIEKFKDIVFNPNSGPQLQKLLYEQLDLPVIDLTDTKQPATGGDTLKKLGNHTDDPVIQKLLTGFVTYSQTNKILTSFIPAFEKAIQKGNQPVVWLHGSFNLGGTVSGRLSSSDPNLQNIPAGSTYGKLIKSCFVAPKGWLFCGADFNSLEDYISALTTKDPNKLKVYIGHEVYELKTPEKSQIIRDDTILRYRGKEYTSAEFYKTFG